jgi:predicted nucleic acid-binding protein
VLYVDSSALIKRYIREAGSDALNAKLSDESLHQPGGIFISVLGYAEILATFARRLRENARLMRQTELLQKQFRDDWAFELTRVELGVGVLLFIPGLVGKYPLKGSDAIHLASALSLRDALRLGKEFGQANRSITFVSADKQLNRAASAEGLEVFDPQDKN